MEKPEWVSWDEVMKCIHEAQLTNNKKGLDMKFGHMTGEELRRKVGNGYCFVVLDENNRVIGTTTLKVSYLNYWWHKGEAGYHCFEGVLPEYRGTDVYFNMHAAVKSKENELGLKVLWADTAENNKVVLKVCHLRGWKDMRFTTYEGCNYYSVVLAKWINECPYNDNLIKIMFKLMKTAVKIVYKPGRVNRFVFWK